MGLKLCPDFGVQLEKFGYVDADDIRDENTRVRVKPPAKIVKCDNVGDGNDDIDTNDKSDSVIKAAEAGNPFRAKTSQHLQAKKASGLPKNSPSSSLEIKPTAKSWRKKSLAEKMAEIQNNFNLRDEFALKGLEGERVAKLYMKTLEDNTVDQLTETFEDVVAIVTLETETMGELQRQRKVVKQANRDLHATEKDINDTTHRLKGMKSIGNKFVNMMFRKPSHYASAQIFDSDTELDTGIKHSSTVPIKLPSQRGKNKAAWIEEGVDQLCHLLDVVEQKEIEMGHELEKQEEALHRLDQNMDHIEIKIEHQNKLMTSLTRK